MTKPVLSICIPTKNRIGDLARIVKTAISQINKIPDSAGKFELVIADNCSTDRTEEICRGYMSKYPGVVSYTRNASDIGGLNFERALSLGRGEFRKLHNNNLDFKPNAIHRILTLIERCRNEQPLIFFSNGNSPVRGDEVFCKNMSEFLQNASYFITWIGGFGIWERDFHSIKDFSRSANLMLPHTDVLLQLSSQSPRQIVVNDKLFFRKKEEIRHGYNVAEVFGKNYLSLLAPYVNSGHLGRSFYEHEKKRILIEHIIPYHFSSRDNFSRDGFFRNLNEYFDDQYFFDEIEALIYGYVDKSKRKRGFRDYLDKLIFWPQ
jgi:glycosyltransferase involved in cell wall biosynthesis